MDMKRYIVTIVIAMMCAAGVQANAGNMTVTADATANKAAVAEADASANKAAVAEAGTTANNAAVAEAGATASEASVAAAQVGEDFKVIKDETVGGIRHIIAVPSSLVCSKQIDIDIDVKTKTIVGGRYYRGCSGNAQGIMALVKGMKIDEAISKLEGINCAGRGTSCPDQLAKVLKSLKW